MAAPIVNQNLRFEDSFKVHNIYINEIKNMCVCYNILYGMICGIVGDFEGF